MALMFLYPSLILGVLGFILIRFYPGVKLGAQIALLASLLLVAATVFYLVCDHFSGNGINDAAIFHILYLIDLNVLLQFWPYLFVFPAALFLMYLIWCFYSVRWSAPDRYFFPSGTIFFRGFMALVGWGAIFSGLAIHPAVSDSQKMIEQLYLNESARELSSFIQSDVPKNNPINQKSFIYIYAESLERTFFNDARFPGLMPEMKLLEQQALRVEGIRQAPMTGWTIAGMTASQCGFPLSTYKEGRNTISVVDEILPGSVCVGDILSDAGYHLSYMGGASLNFSYKGGFYSDHGFDEIMGGAELDAYAGRELPKSKWGVYDDDLYSLAYKKWDEVSELDKPYGFFMLTLDTHSPLGHQTPACGEIKYGDGSNEMLNAVHCADKLLATFLRKIMASPKARDITIFVGSDHFMMQNRVGLLPDQSDRTNMWMVFDKNISPSVITRQATTLDISPTVLNVLGYEVHAYGLGRNLLNINQKTLVEIFGEKSFFDQLVLWRAEFWKLWKASADN